jgi:hypothetical protein
MIGQGRSFPTVNFPIVHDLKATCHDPDATAPAPAGFVVEASLFGDGFFDEAD